MSWYPKSPFPSLVPVHITQALTAGTCFSRLWLWAGWHILFCGPTQNFCQCDVTVSFPLNVTLHFITNLTQFPSVWCYEAALINLFQCDWQIIYHQALSVWCYRSSIIHLCQCDVTNHPSSICVSVMLQIIHHPSLSVSCYRSSISVSVMLQIVHHPSLSVSCYRSSIIHLCQCHVTDHPSLSVWCYISSIIHLCQCNWQIIHHPSLSVWCYR